MSVPCSRLSSPGAYAAPLHSGLGYPALIISEVKVLTKLIPDIQQQNFGHRTDVQDLHRVRECDLTDDLN